MGKFISYSKAIFHTLKIGILWLALVVQGVFGILLFGYYAIAAILGSKKGAKVWYQLDVLVATIIFNTELRTVSGITGERLIHKGSYWVLIAKFVDIIMYVFDKQWDHCKRAYLWEKKEGLIK